LIERQPTLTDQPPESEDWLHDVKHDSYRAILVMERFQT
jgi:hypothetical protein